MPQYTTILVASALASFLVGCTTVPEAAPVTVTETTHIQSLSELSIETLRARTYGTELRLEKQLGGIGGGTEYSDAYASTGSGPYETYIASYMSDGLRLYTRIDLPKTPPPKDGYPVIVFCHGWVGIEAAPEFHFSYTPESVYAEMIDGYVDAGFVVLTPGYRGHGTVNGIAADGIEYMAAWDNATYLSPSFYAIDVLNLIEGLGSLKDLDFPGNGNRSGSPVSVDLDRVSLSAHSQGGDVLLTVLAVAGERSSVATSIAAASISDGTFAPRLEQLRFYSAMQGTRRAFLSGDGDWNGTAVGSNGTINPEFVFGFPPDWIETPHPAKWTWQAERWPDVPVAEVVRKRSDELYAAMASQVTDLRGAGFEISREDDSKSHVRHDPRVARGMEAIGGFDRPQFLTERLMLHYSDQDFYSPPAWNLDLCDKVNRAEGDCTDFLYAKNTHSMRASARAWFSPAGTKDSYRTILARDIRFFSGKNPAEITYP